MRKAAALATVLLAAAALLVPGGAAGAGQPPGHRSHAPTHVAGPYGLSPLAQRAGSTSLDH